MPMPAATTSNDIEYVSLTELARDHNPTNPGYVIKRWLQNQNTIELRFLA